MGIDVPLGTYISFIPHLHLYYSWANPLNYSAWQCPRGKSLTFCIIQVHKNASFLFQKWRPNTRHLWVLICR
jgi:hypothetical protein